MRNNYQEIVMPFLGGAIQEEIADRLGVSRQRIQQILSHYGIGRFDGGQFKSIERRTEYIANSSDKTNAELAKELGITSKRVSRARSKWHISSGGAARRGEIGEQWFHQQAISRGLTSSLMQHGSPYDIIVNGHRVDVKTSFSAWEPPSQKGRGSRSPAYRFQVGGGKKRADCDFYSLIIWSASPEVFIVPSDDISKQQPYVVIVWPDSGWLKSRGPRWHEYRGRWGLLS